MKNWYKSLQKVARRGSGDPLMDQYSRYGKPDSEESTGEQTITTPNPFFGANERSTGDGKGYPKGVSMYEDTPVNKDLDQLPVDRTLLDDEIPIGEGLDLNTFSDEVDKAPIKKPEPIGPHNMNGKDIYDKVVRRIGLKSLKHRI